MLRKPITLASLTLFAAASLVLAGCAATEPSEFDQGAPVQSASATPTSTPVLSSEEALAEAMKYQMGATVLEVIDPRTFNIEPAADEQAAGVSGEATVTIREGSPLVTPAEGECGYDEALAFAKQYFAENPDDAFVVEGSFSTEFYYDEAITSGFAYIPDDDGQENLYGIPQADAENASAGLYALCPDFGE
jgi:hypothetical protein